MITIIVRRIDSQYHTGMNDRTNPTIDLREPIRSLVSREPGYARILETFEIEYCCSGDTTLEDAARERGLNPDSLAARMDKMLHEYRAARENRDGAGDLSLRDLLAQIASRYHRHFRNELPRLVNLTRRVASAHGADDKRLNTVADRAQVIAETLLRHVDTEENLLFPLVRAGVAPHYEDRTALVDRLNSDHLVAEQALTTVRCLTDRYDAPEHACNTYRAALAALRDLDQDCRSYAHLERDTLFPRCVTS